MSTSKENIPQEKKCYEFSTTCFNPRTSSKDEYFIQMKLEGNKIDFTAQKLGDISELRYTSSSTYEELKQSQVLNLFNSINEIYESLLGSIKSVQASGQEQLIHIDLLKGSLNLKIPINFKDLYFELKAQEYSLEYINLSDVDNDLRSTSHGTQHSSTSKNFQVGFFVRDFVVGVEGHSNMTIEKLIKNFKIKLCNEDIKIRKYLVHPTGVELVPNSTETLASKGITEKTIINVVTN